MQTLTKKHIFKCMLEDRPIELWLPSTESRDPVNMASHELLMETGIYVHHMVDSRSDVCLRVTHPIRVFWKWTKMNHFSDDESCVVDGVKYNIRDLEIGETIQLDKNE